MTTVASNPLALTGSPPPGADVVPPDIGTGSEGSPTLAVVAWTDPVIDTLGHDPRSWYVEQFWLGIIGPTSTWLLRRIAGRFDTDPDGFELNLDETARSLGLGGREGRHSPFQRALSRCVSFKLARPHGPGALAVHRRIPPLTLRQIDKLPPSLQTLHAEWSASQNRTGRVNEARDRSRRLALKLLDIGADRTAVELQLIRWRVHPAVAHEATQWAMSLPTILPAFS
jgi:hypothetical protein